MVKGRQPDCGTVALRLLAALASTALVACTYNFDRFAANPDAPFAAETSSAGGTAIADAEMPRGGAGGAAASTGGSSSTGSPDAGSGGDIGAPVDAGAGSDRGTVATMCEGLLHAGICWYLGPEGSSCQQVCTSHGEPAPDAASHVGTNAQGGSLAECTAILGLLGVSGAPTSATRSDGLGLGCHVYRSGVLLLQTNKPYWLASPSFSATASQSSSTLACGCTK